MGILTYFFDKLRFINIFIICIFIIYFTILFLEPKFRSYFFHFGPGDPPIQLEVNGVKFEIPDDNTIYFFSTPIQTWTTVILSYFLVFLVGICFGFFNHVYTDHLNEIHGGSKNTIKRNKLDYYFVIVLFPILFAVIIAGSFISTIFQMQYLICFYLGFITILVPYSYHKTSTKKFIGE